MKPNNFIYKFILVIMAFTITTCTTNKMEFTDWGLVASNMNFPEGPAWDGKNTIVVSNCYGGWLTRIRDGIVDTLLTAGYNTFSQTNGLIFDSNGNLFACDYKLGSILKIGSDLTVSPFVETYDGNSFNRPNDIVFDRQENIYFTDPKSYGNDKLDGRVFFIDMTTQDVSLAADSLAFPNGIAFSPRDNKLYVCESAKNHIARFDVKAPGMLANKEIFVKLAGGDPDGIAFDIKGNLYVAHFGTGTVFVISPDAEIIKELKAPGKKPTNLEFAGAEMKDLYLTEVETNAVYHTKTTIPGCKLIK